MANQSELLSLSVSNLIAAASDPEGGKLSLGSVSSSSKQGHRVNYNDFNQTVVYQPAFDFRGEDEFSYTVRDEEGLSVTMTATITVLGRNQLPQV